MPGKPTTVTQYLASLPKDRRDALQALGKVIRASLGKGFEEGMQYGMPSWYVPHSVYPSGYHCDATQPLPYAGMASQKNYMSLYLFCVYSSEKEQRAFREAWAKTGKKLDMGKSCIRFKSIDDLALDVIAGVIKRTTAKKHIALYEAAFGDKRRPARKKAAKKTAAKKKRVTAGKKIVKKASTKKPVARKTRGGAARKIAKKPARRR